MEVVLLLLLQKQWDFNMSVQQPKCNVLYSNSVKVWAAVTDKNMMCDVYE